MSYMTRKYGKDWKKVTEAELERKITPVTEEVSEVKPKKKVAVKKDPKATSRKK